MINSINTWAGRAIVRIKVAQGALFMEPIIQLSVSEKQFVETLKDQKLNSTEPVNNLVDQKILVARHRNNDLHHNLTKLKYQWIKSLLNEWLNEFMNYWFWRVSSWSFLTIKVSFLTVDEVMTHLLLNKRICF